MNKQDYHAILSINGLPDMKKPTVKRLTKWLYALAHELEKADPKEYSARFRARLMK